MFIKHTHFVQLMFDVELANANLFIEKTSKIATGARFCVIN